MDTLDPVRFFGLNPIPSFFGFCHGLGKKYG